MRKLGKWKIIPIIAVVLVITGIAAKIVIDKLFSFILMSYIGDIGDIGMGVMTQGVISAMLGDEDAGLQANGSEKQAGEGGLTRNLLDGLVDGAGESEVDLSGNERDKGGQQESQGAAGDGNDTGGQGKTAQAGKMEDKGKETQAQDKGTEGGNARDTGVSEKDAQDSAQHVVQDGEQGDMGGGALDGETRDEKIADEEAGNTGADSTAANGTEDIGTGDGEGKAIAAGSDEGGYKDENTVDVSIGVIDGEGKESAAGEDKDSARKDDAAGENGAAGGNNTGDESDVVVKITQEKIEEAEKTVSTGDKLKVIQIIFKKLQPYDWDVIKGILKKGKVTRDDINTVKNLVKNRVTEEEKEYLKEVYNKYYDEIVE